MSAESAIGPRVRLEVRLILGDWAGRRRAREIRRSARNGWSVHG